MTAMGRRSLLLAGALALTLGAVLATSRDDQVEVAPPAPHQEAAPPAEPTEALRLELLQASRAGRPVQDLFAGHTWHVAPPPPPARPAKPPPPPRPTAPALPFTYLGRLEEEASRSIVYLVKADRVYAVSEGDVLDGTYRVEAIAPHQVTLLYLPLQVRQTLATGEGK